MSYQTRKEPIEPVEAVPYDGRPLPDIGLNYVQHRGDVIAYVFLHETGESETVFSTDWIVNGELVRAADFDALYEPITEPVPEPEPVVEPEPIVEEAPVVDPDPPAARAEDNVQETAIAPPAIHPE